MRSLAKKLFALLFVCGFIFIGCNSKKNWHSTTLFFFDTFCEIKTHSSPSMSKSVQEEAQRIFSEIESCFSPQSTDYSSPLVLKLFARSLNIYHDSNGFFDITVAPLTQAWNFFKKPYRIPSQKEIAAALQLVGMEKVKKNNRSIFLLPGMKLDWGGIAKGFGVDLASKSIRALGVQKGFINAGGDLYCWGNNPENQPWQIGIKHPRKEGFIGILSLHNTGAATTGDYQRYFEANGIRYHHVFNPFTGFPSQNKQSVTVIGPETLLCDALSTALFVSDHPGEILKKYFEYGAVVIDSEGTVSILGKSYPLKLLSSNL
jgi:thiamine biosynthesis lipoprotein